jgi:hypothetical protein
MPYSVNPMIKQKPFPVMSWIFKNKIKALMGMRVSEN